MKKLYPVTISQADSCLTYALKRVGREDLIAKGFNCGTKLEKFCKLIKYNDILSLKVGDIICWDKPIKYMVNSAWRNEITEEGLVISRERLIQRHFGVVELGGRYSEAADNQGLWIGIAVKSLVGRPNLDNNPPTYVLRFKNQKELIHEGIFK